MPTYVPTVTSKTKHVDVPIVLFSPSKRNCVLPRNEKVLVDCHTYFLKYKLLLNRTEKVKKAVDHYFWYTEFARCHSSDRRLTFIVPDCDWVGDTASQIVDEWVKKSNNVNCLVMPSESHFKVVVTNVVGYCLRKRVTSPVHPEWTHTFSQPIKPLKGKTKMWTYDSVSPLEVSV